MKPPERSPKKVLVVEDEPSIGKVCRRVLAAAGLEVDVAANGKIAQDMIRKKRYDLCLVDIRTPLMSGKELYQWMKKRHPELASKVVFTTGDVMSGDTHDFVRETARPFLPKPFTPDELRAVVAKAFGKMGNDLCWP